MKKTLFLLALACGVSAAAQTYLPVKKVTIFKNATAMVIMEGNAPINEGVAKLPIPPKALYGTYFVGGPRDNAIKGIVFRNDTLKKPAKCASVWQYLAANTGKACTISYSPSTGIDKAVAGKVLDYDLYSGILRFTTDAGKILVLHVDKIYQADFKEEPSQWYMADSIKRVMLIQPEKKMENFPMQEVYVTGGINWVPSYYLRLKDDKTGRLEMKAIVENYAGSIKDGDVELVVGSPQMSYSGTPDPMTYDYVTVSNYDNNAGSLKVANYMQSNAMTTAFAREETGGDGYFESSYTTEGEKTDDQYIYKLGKVTVPENSKGCFPIFAGNIDYKDKYEGTIYDFTSFYSNRYVPDDEKTFDVFHSLELKNTASVPLTTAAVMVVNDKEQFVAQDQIKYTPVGANTTIRLSKAIDIIMKNMEEEKTRVDNAKKIGKVNYSKVTLKGTITIENYQQKEVTIAVTKNLNGTVVSQSDDGKSTKKTSYSYQNPWSEIKWDVKLGPNEKKSITYEYEVLFTP